MQERITAQFENAQGEKLGPLVTLPMDATKEQLDLILKEWLPRDEDSEERQYTYNVGEKAISTGLIDVLDKEFYENLISIVYQPESLFKVRAVTRCSSTLSGHEESILVASFSPTGKHLASGSGDKTVRFWDLSTETPFPKAEQPHSGWILCLAWSPDGRWLASGSMDNKVVIWENSQSGFKVRKIFQGHKQCITALTWQPYHLTTEQQPYSLLASASKDSTIKVWDPLLGNNLLTLSQHTLPVTCLRWSGKNWLISGSRDRSIKIWDMHKRGILIQSLSGHAHWVNTLALSTDYALRTGPFDPESLFLEKNTDSGNISVLKERAQKAYNRCIEQGGPERLVSASDDHTIFLWNLNASKIEGIQQVGHQGIINQVCFSPNARYFISASFDKSLKLWDGIKGTYIATFRGHVGAIYQVAWSSDSRQVISGSKDGTLKLWQISTRKVRMNLPGHLDEVFTVDWSPDGERVVSGSRDKTLKLWRH